MQLTEQHIIRPSDPRWQAIDRAAWFSKNIDNAANFCVRQAYIKEGRYTPYRVLETQFKKRDRLADQADGVGTSWGKLIRTTPSDTAPEGRSAGFATVGTRLASLLCGSGRVPGAS